MGKKDEALNKALAQKRSKVPEDPGAARRARVSLGLDPKQPVRRPESPSKGRKPKPPTPTYLLYCLGCRELRQVVDLVEDYWCPDCVEHDSDHHDLGGEG